MKAPRPSLLSDIAVALAILILIVTVLLAAVWVREQLQPTRTFTGAPAKVFPSP